MRTPVIHFWWKKELQGRFEAPQLQSVLTAALPLPSWQVVWGSSLYLHQHKLPMGARLVPMLKIKGDACFSWSPQCNGFQQARGAPQGPAYTPASWCLMCQDPDHSQHQYQNGQGESSDGHMCPSWCLVLGQEGAGQPQGAGGGGTQLDPTPALPGHPAQPTRCPLADPAAWRRARTSSAGL